MNESCKAPMQGPKPGETPRAEFACAACGTLHCLESREHPLGGPALIHDLKLVDKPPPAPGD